jgi:hypothetical protein
VRTAAPYEGLMPSIWLADAILNRPATWAAEQSSTVTFLRGLVWRTANLLSTNGVTLLLAALPVTLVTLTSAG